MHRFVIGLSGVVFILGSAPANAWLFTNGHQLNGVDVQGISIQGSRLDGNTSRTVREVPQTGVRVQGIKIVGGRMFAASPSDQGNP